MSDENPAPSPPLVAPPVTPSSTTTTTTETVKTTVGATDGANGTASVVVVTQSKIALLTQAAASIVAGIFALALSLAFVTPVFTGRDSIITAGEFIGGIAAAAGIITGSTFVNRNAQARSSDIARPAPTTSTP